MGFMRKFRRNLNGHMSKSKKTRYDSMSQMIEQALKNLEAKKETAEVISTTATEVVAEAVTQN